MSDTPRTDAEVDDAGNVSLRTMHQPTWVVPAAFARELETENAALLAALEAIAKAPFHDSDLDSLIDTHRAIAKKAIVDAKGGQA